MRLYNYKEYYNDEWEKESTLYEIREIKWSRGERRGKEIWKCKKTSQDEDHPERDCLCSLQSDNTNTSSNLSRLPMSPLPVIVSVSQICPGDNAQTVVHHTFSLRFRGSDLVCNSTVTVSLVAEIPEGHTHSPTPRGSHSQSQRVTLTHRVTVQLKFKGSQPLSTLTVSIFPLKAPCHLSKLWWHKSHLLWILYTIYRKLLCSVLIASAQQNIDWMIQSHTICLTPSLCDYWCVCVCHCVCVCVCIIYHVSVCVCTAYACATMRSFITS